MTEQRAAAPAGGDAGARTLQKAGMLVEARQFASAAALAGAYLAEHPNDPDAQVVLGEAYAGLGRAGEAKAAYRRALGADPTHYKASVLLAHAYLAARDQQAALDVARTLVRTYPDAWGAHLTLAWVAVDTKDRTLLSEAYAAARRAVELEPGEAENHVALGLAAQRLGNKDVARRANEEALRLDPTNAAALNNRGLSMKRFRPGRWTAEVDTYARSAAMDPHDPVARHNLAVMAYNTLNRTGWLLFVPMFITIVASIAVSPVGRAGEISLGPVAVGVALQLLFWGAWALFGYRRIPAGRHAMMGRVVRTSGPVLTIAISLGIFAAASIVLILVSPIVPGLGGIMFPLLIAHRVVEWITRSVLNRRNPDRR
ncbi:tetratricopeptide repeat protein [Tsukamurella paurometabola]|uniref:Predicted O-linked N-acetylglucosamine transferase, SPINDLY family n=1 Tax=Tsukamurella paurometabola TaxID=2061 RepID=A0A3P8KKN7_TSUPA|nr:tetratricopeptide repeat protein [Tsukamurella paurometabola]UEA84037.1 tetratricopeptide repeat protein [Tsukamurella paurometabola]VDR41198.1 Predicted O-linked N-acetylglucosamine transferase, SPINDLY family [Tsukamurella paurometabola]